MIDDEKAHVIGSYQEHGQAWLTIETVAGDVLEILRPVISEEYEAELMAQVRAIVEAENTPDGH